MCDATALERSVSPPDGECRQRKDETDRCEQAAKTGPDRIEAAAEITAAEFLVDRFASRNGSVARAALAERVSGANVIESAHVKIPEPG
jgi:hypothetical protein